MSHSPSEPRSADVEAIIGRLRDELRLLDKLGYTMAAAHLSQALDALEEESLHEREAR